jgi:hypothetical protein
MSLSAVSPRVFQLYSPRRPSPLGLPPLAPHSDTQPCSAYPKTPERYYHQHYNFSEPNSHGMRFPPDVHRRTTTTTQRGARASPPAPLSLDAQYHPAAAAMVHLPSIEETLQPRVPQAPSPTPSSTSSLSLYSAESAKKSLEIGEEGEGEGRTKGGGGGFCLCFSAFPLSYFYSLSIIFNPDFSALFGTKSKPNKILAPQAQVQQVLAAEPSPAPQMVQTRRRPPSLVLVQ